MELISVSGTMVFANYISMRLRLRTARGGVERQIQKWRSHTGSYCIFGGHEVRGLSVCALAVANASIGLQMVHARPSRGNPQVLDGRWGKG